MNDFAGGVLTVALMLAVISLVFISYNTKAPPAPTCAQELRGMKLIAVQVREGASKTCVYGVVK